MNVQASKHIAGLISKMPGARAAIVEAHQQMAEAVQAKAFERLVASLNPKRIPVTGGQTLKDNRGLRAALRDPRMVSANEKGWTFGNREALVRKSRPRPGSNTPSRPLDYWRAIEKGRWAGPDHRGAFLDSTGQPTEAPLPQKPGKARTHKGASWSKPPRNSKGVMYGKPEYIWGTKTVVPWKPRDWQSRAMGNFGQERVGRGVQIRRTGQPLSNSLWPQRTTSVAKSISSKAGPGHGFLIHVGPASGKFFLAYSRMWFARSSIAKKLYTEAFARHGLPTFVSDKRMTSSRISGYGSWMADSNAPSWARAGQTRIGGTRP